MAIVPMKPDSQLAATIPPSASPGRWVRVLACSPSALLRNNGRAGLNCARRDQAREYAKSLDVVLLLLSSFDGLQMSAVAALHCRKDVDVLIWLKPQNPVVLRFTVLAFFP